MSFFHVRFFVSLHSTGGLAVTGGGTLSLGGTNTYTGATVVSNGTLRLDGTLGSTATTVSGGTLSGIGTTAGSVTVGSGGTIAIPAAQRGAHVVGVDLTPELLEHARRRAAEAGVEIEWVEADAQSLPFADASFDRVLSTFGAMFAPDHARAAAELVRVCRPGGLVAMATWANDGFPGGLFKLTGRSSWALGDYLRRYNYA